MVVSVGEGLRRKDQEKSRRWLRGRTARVQEGESNSRRDVRPETDRREETGGTGQYYGSGVHRLGESFWHGTHRDGDATVDGSTRSDVEHVREDNSKIRSIGGVWRQDWTQTWQRAESAAVHSSTGPYCININTSEMYLLSYAVTCYFYNCCDF